MMRLRDDGKRCGMGSKRAVGAKGMHV